MYDNLNIGSTDVKALYPSLDIDFTVDKVCEVFFESDISIQGIDFAELGLYLALTASPDLLTELGIADMCPTRKTAKRRPPKEDHPQLQQVGVSNKERNALSRGIYLSNNRISTADVLC